MKEVKGTLTARGLKVALVVSRFNEFITQKLLEGALDCLRRHEIDEKGISVYWTPGSFEIPMVVARLAEQGGVDAIVGLGAVIKGDTEHYRFIASEVIKGLATIGLQHKIPVILGVITPDTLEQAIERAGTKAGNKGFQAALSAIEMAQLYRALRQKK